MVLLAGAALLAAPALSLAQAADGAAEQAARQAELEAVEGNIALTKERPPTTWNLAAPDEYGFFANVNPAVDHPRWSQAHERRIGDLAKRPTLPFNGYADAVASLYDGLDLREDY